MESARAIIDELKRTHRLAAPQYKSLLENNDSDELLQSQARAVALAEFGKGIFIRGLIEISNYCKNNCYYCGIRAANKDIDRYRLSQSQILDCCSKGHEKGFRTFVLQAGEDSFHTDEWVEKLIISIRSEFPDCAITLSLGERTGAAYRRFKAAGADRYLLRHETFDESHYSRLHPAGMSRRNRLECLETLKSLGYQTGTGIMVGSPGQTTDNIVSDLMFIQDFCPQMIGIGPFIHQDNTPFRDEKDGSVELTLKLISIFRLMNPRALIPATTALSTLDTQSGHIRGIMAGANVIMPNLSPALVRKQYALYEGKTADGSEAAEGIQILKKELETIGYNIVVGRGDYVN